MKEEELYKAQSVGIIHTINTNLNQLDLFCTRHIIKSEELDEIKEKLYHWSREIRKELDVEK